VISKSGNYILSGKVETFAGQAENMPKCPASTDQQSQRQTINNMTLGRGSIESPFFPRAFLRNALEHLFVLAGFMQLLSPSLHHVTPFFAILPGRAAAAPTTDKVRLPPLRPR